MTHSVTGLDCLLQDYESVWLFRAIIIWEAYNSTVFRKRMILAYTEDASARHVNDITSERES